MLAEGRRGEALEVLEEAMAISRETGLGFHGPNILGALAEAAQDPQQRRRALAEGEAIIRGGAVGHNHLRFYPDAITTALDLGEWDEAERYAEALEDYTRPEPLPWSDFFVARGRALAALGRGRRRREHETRAGAPRRPKRAASTIASRCRRSSSALAGF